MPERVVLLRVTIPPFPMPPACDVTVFPEIVLPAIVNSALTMLRMPPLLEAEFPEIMLSVIVSAPE